MIYGTSDMTVAEMVSSYATFANKGVHTKPLYITRIEDKNGNVLAEFRPERTESINEQTAYLMLNLMEGVADFGTAVAPAVRTIYTAQIAEKQVPPRNHSDGWFIGITPKMVAGAWVGAEDRSVHFDRMEWDRVLIWLYPFTAYFMQKVYADNPWVLTKRCF